MSTFIEKDRRAAAAIDALAREWQETAVWVQAVDALSWLERIPAPAAFDIVFLDPPYDSDLLGPALAHTGAAQAARAGCARVRGAPRARAIASRCRRAGSSVRDGRAGEVGYHLLAT